MKVLASTALAACLLAGCAIPRTDDAAVSADAYRAMLSSALRTDADRGIDDRRLPVELLQFAGVRPGMKVLDVAAGGGYTSQLLAIAVGPSGKLWAQASNPGARINDRLKAHPQPNFIVVKRPFDDPVPPEAAPLDVVTLILNYHDITYLPVDRDAMNRKIFAALKPGGRYIVVDHSALPGTGISVGKTLHRIEEAFVVAEVKKAGFVLDAEGSFLRNPSDNRAETSEPPKHTDKFVLRFVKPR
jgi:predicted methyltransferase